jgi:oxygen-dependent protoporphyrinogen oxidase
MTRAGSGSVVVVGGGISGLAAAYEAAGTGARVLLAEAADRLGGKIRTEHVDGFVVEAGPDSFISYRPAATELARELGLGDAIIRTNEPRSVFIRAGGRLVRMPDGMGLVLPTRMAPFVTTRLFSWPQKLRAGVDVVLPRRLDGADVSIGSFLRARLGPAMVDRLADPLLGGIYGAPVDELSLFAVVPQLRDYERQHRSLLLASLAQGRAARARSKAAAAGGQGGTRGGPTTPGGASAGGAAGSGSPVLSLAGGLGSLVDALADAIRRSADVEIRLGTRVTGLARDGARTRVTLADGTRLTPDAVVLAAPAPATAALLADEVPAAAAAIDAIPHGTTGVVTLGYREEALTRPLPGHGILVATDEPLAVGACTLTSAKWAGRAPDGTILVRAFLPERSAAVLAGDDEAVAGAVHLDLVTLLGLRELPVLRRVARWQEAMPRYTVGHLDRVAAAEAALAARPELLLVGGAFHGVGIPECISRGAAAGRRAAELAAAVGAEPAGAGAGAELVAAADAGVAAAGPGAEPAGVAGVA